MDRKELLEKLRDLERFLEEECEFYTGTLTEEARKYREWLESLEEQEQEAE